MEIKERALGPGHPDTAASLNNLVALLLKKADYDGAEPAFAQFLRGLENLHGADHPATMEIRSILEQVRQLTGAGR